MDIELETGWNLEGFRARNSMKLGQI